MVPTKHAKNIFQQILTLSTAAFGLAAALAWNEVILTVFKRYLSFDAGSEILSRLLYAIIVTILAVTVTVYLTRLKDRFEEKNER